MVIVLPPHSKIKSAATGLGRSEEVFNPLQQVVENSEVEFGSGLDISACGKLIELPRPCLQPIHNSPSEYPQQEVMATRIIDGDLPVQPQSGS